MLLRLFNKTFFILRSTEYVEFTRSKRIVRNDFACKRPFFEKRHEGRKESLMYESLTHSLHKSFPFIL